MKRRMRGFFAVVCIMLGLLFVASCGEEKPVEGVRVGALKGPTTIGLLKLLDKNKQQETKDTYDFTMAVGADELMPLMVKGELDFALVPANVAAIMYQKTEGGIVAVDINTLGVLYLVTGEKKLVQIRDLAGETVYLTGKGTTPDYVLQYILRENGVTDCKLEYKSEATEVAAILAANPDKIGLLPQPFVAAALFQNEALQVGYSMQDAWVETTGGVGNLVTGVTVVRKAFLEEHPQTVKRFLEEHEASTGWMREHTKEGAGLCVEVGIVAKEEIASSAIPQCNLVCLTGKDLKENLSAYLQVLYDMDSATVGGALPGEDFYFAE